MHVLVDLSTQARRVALLCHSATQNYIETTTAFVILLIHAVFTLINQVIGQNQVYINSDGCIFT